MQWKTLVATSNPKKEQQLRQTLTALGIQFRVVHSGTELLAQVYQEPFRLVLLDTELNEITGFEACQRLRELEWLQETPIILLTLDWEEETILRVYQSKANDFIVTPLQINLLQEKIKMWLERWDPSSQENKRTNSETSLPPVGALTMGLTVGGRYRIIKEVGRGGMGAVYQVWDERLQTDLGMKVVSTHDWERNDEVQQRFQREVDALAKIRHPCVVRIYDTATWDRFQYYTMEYLPNGTLHQMIKQQRTIQPLLALSTIAKLAEALDFTHERGIIHRDLKSSNILISESHSPMIIDFGSMITTEHTDTRLTPGEFVIGTPYFMAPEQLTDPEGVDYRCDIYSLGAVLYEFLTGHVPFTGRNIHEAMLAVVQEGIPSPKESNPDLDQELAALCLRATAHKQEDRFQSAGEFAQACHQLMASLRISAGQLPAIQPVLQAR